MKHQLSSTQGQHYDDQNNRIDYYPDYSLPVPCTRKENALMLEVGPGWGRWLVSGAKKGYIPIGVDMRLSHTQSVMQTMKDYGLNAYMVISDLSSLPFKPGVFDFVWSFSAIQHAHRDKAISCLQHINRVLSSDGFTKLEFPNLNGIHNRFGPVQSQAKEWDNKESMCVRYYSLSDYKQQFNEVFGNCTASIHSLLGIGVLPEDIKHVTWKRKPLVAASLLLTALARLVPGTASIADSLYLTAHRKTPVTPPYGAMGRFLTKHREGYNNLSIVELMQCPYTGSELKISPDRKYLISESAGLKFPVMDNTPVMLPDYHEKL
jgi:uncharacterized protein YbaR (Trm112 family)/SAM-dependent methyltransferase